MKESICVRPRHLQPVLACSADLAIIALSPRLLQIHSAFHFFSPPDISAKDVGIAGFAASADLVVLMKVRKNTG